MEGSFATFTTNAFRVTDEEKYLQLKQMLTAPYLGDHIEFYSLPFSDGSIAHIICGEGNVSYNGMSNKPSLPGRELPRDLEEIKDNTIRALCAFAADVGAILHWRDTFTCTRVSSTNLGDGIRELSAHSIIGNVYGISCIDLKRETAKRQKELQDRPRSFIFTEQKDGEQDTRKLAAKEEKPLIDQPIFAPTDNIFSTYAAGSTASEAERADRAADGKSGD